MTVEATRCACSITQARVDPSVVAKAVEGIALFQGLSQDDRAILFQSMYEFEFAPGDYIMKKARWRAVPEARGRKAGVPVVGPPELAVSLSPVPGRGGQIPLHRCVGPSSGHRPPQRREISC